MLFEKIAKISAKDINPVHVAKSDIQIINDDCRNVLAQMADNSVHLVLTDPPYFLDGLDNDWKKGNEKAKKATGAIGGLPVGMKFDPAQGLALQQFMHEIAVELSRVLVPGGFFLSFSQPRLSARMAVGIEDAGFEIRDIYAWHFTKRAQMKAFSQDHFVDKMDVTDAKKKKIKKNLRGRKTPQFRPQYESIIMAQNPKEGTFINNWLEYQSGLIDVSQTLDGTAPSTVMTVEKPSGDERLHGHMTPKPVKLLRHLIEVFSCQGQTVLDPFLGSGSTAIASKRAKRSCIGIDIELEYTKIAKRRINDDTKT